MMAEPIPITGPAEEPVSLPQARAHLHVDDDNTAADTQIEEMVAAAREAAEHEMGRKILRQTWDFVLDAFPCAGAAIRLPGDLVKAHSIVHIKYLDTAGLVQIVDPLAYALDPHSLPGYIFPAVGASWPGDVADSANAVSVRMSVGEWERAADVPAAIKRWIKLHIGTQWRYEGSITPEQAIELTNRFSDRLLDPWRVYTL